MLPESREYVSHVVEVDILRETNPEPLVHTEIQIGVQPFGF
jgi:hypothetical protein